MEAANKDKPTAIVIGSGISGEVAALKLVEAGYAVTINEGASRVGGKIASQTLNGQSVDLGAEFVDTDHKGLRELCTKYGIQLKDATDQSHEEYVLPNGKRISGEKFSKAAESVQQRIIADKQRIAQDPLGKRAQQLDGMSLEQYLQQIGGAEQAAKESASLMKRAGALFKRAWNAVTPGYAPTTQDVVATMKGIYVAESGRDAKNISALQYVNEMSSEPGQFLASDCASRIVGGTETVVKALRNDLESKGVKFNVGSDSLVTNVAKQNGKFQIELNNGDKQQADKIVLAAAMPALAKIGGLESLGFSQDSMDIIRNGQYTHSTKFSIATKGDGKDACTYNSEGFQAWRSAPGVMTFLVGGETMNQQKGKDLVEHVVNAYAAAQGSTADKLFDGSKIVYSGVNPSAPCYLSPAPGQVTKLAALSRDADALAANGVGLAGTYLPQRIQGNAATGFMECGVQSAERAVKLMVGKELETSQEAPMLTTKFQDQVKAERNGRAAANDGQYTLRA